jgi:hypothetical protein
VFSPQVFARSLLGAVGHRSTSLCIPPPESRTPLTRWNASRHQSSNTKNAKLSAHSTNVRAKSWTLFDREADDWTRVQYVHNTFLHLIPASRPDTHRRRFGLSPALDCAKMSVDEPAATHHLASLMPAATPTAQGRKRPLRTYSRRSAQPQAQEEEPPNIDGEQRATTSDSRREESPEHPPLPSRENQAEQVQRPGRGSILAYFKPLPPSSDKARSDVASSDPVEAPSTPPTPPPQPSHSRKRRRLTTRPQLNGLGHQSEEEEGDKIRPDYDDLSKESSVDRQDRLPENETSALVRSDAYRALRPALSEVAVNTVDPQDGSTGPLAAGKTKTKKRPDKRPARDMTQTTLSLSIHKEPGFTICGFCDILYNPLNEKDRRDHNRRHAAYSRNKRKAGE